MECKLLKIQSKIKYQFYKLIIQLVLFLQKIIKKLIKMSFIYNIIIKIEFYLEIFEFESFKFDFSYSFYIES